MIPAVEWNPLQTKLKEYIPKAAHFNDAIGLCIEMHSRVHAPQVSGRAGTYEELLWDGLDEEAFRTMPTAKDATIAWNIWHIARIEDLVSNILIAEGSQVFDENWMKRMNASFMDTGNAMSDEEILQLSSELVMIELRNYRTAVGRRTQEILKTLRPNDMKRKPRPSSLFRILEEGGVLDAGESRWLLDFWGRKDVGGLLMMPITRHHVVHLNDSFRLKDKILKSRGKEKKQRG
jgi:hypothetical protein